MLTAAFYRVLAARLRVPGGPNTYVVAVGTGRESWDRRPPAETREVTGLAAEVARQAVPPDGIVFLDESGEPTEEPTPRLRLSARFSAGEAIGTLRESGLFSGGTAEEPGSGTLISYVTHGRIEKTEGMTLSRTFRIDLTPRPFVPGTRVTRYLANTSSEELHDLENTVAACQIDEIRFDRRFYFAGVEEAIAAGYDHCAYCFGRELSTR